MLSLLNRICDDIFWGVMGSWKHLLGWQEQEWHKGDNLEDPNCGKVWGPLAVPTVVGKWIPPKE